MSLSGIKVRSGEHLRALLSNLVVEFGPGMCMPIRIEEEKPFRPDALAVFEQASDKPGPQIGQALEDLVGMVGAEIGVYIVKQLAYRSLFPRDTEQIVPRERSGR